MVVLCQVIPEASSVKMMEILQELLVYKKRMSLTETSANLEIVVEKESAPKTLRNNPTFFKY